MALSVPLYGEPAQMSGIVVAGGGLAGAAAACGLAQAGLAVTLIERQAAPVDKICGEFLSHEAQEYLSKLGLDLTGLGAAPISRLRLVRGGRMIETKLPFQGVGLSRRKLDEALLLHAAASGARILRGRTIRALSLGQNMALEVEHEGVMTPEILLLATGKHELRGAKRAFSSGNDLIGFKMYFRLAAAAQVALANHIELVFFAGGYAGLQMVEHGIANLCLLVKRERFVEAGGNWPGLLKYLCQESAYLSGQLQGAAALWDQPLSIYRVPYGFIHRHQTGDPDRLFRLGDQACVIHSFTGDGMAISLHSAALAVQMVRTGKDAKFFHRRLARDVGGQMKRADYLSALLNHATTQPMMFSIAKLWPATLRKAAALTRVPLRARS